MVVCGGVLVVSCVVLLWCCSCRVVCCVLFLLCVCVCDMFLCITGQAQGRGGLVHPRLPLADQGQGRQQRGAHICIYTYVYIDI